MTTFAKGCKRERCFAGGHDVGVGTPAVVCVGSAYIQAPTLAL